MKKRNINIDLIKCVAVFSVISVHFFANVGLYKNVINSTNMYIGIFFRTLFMICVPLFIITTGYLMKNKTLSKKYYLGVLRVLIIYLLDAFIYLGYNTIYNGESFSIRHIIKNILNFDIGYSWYIKMYLGLFLLIPFINLIYNNLKNKKQKQVLILTMLVLTSFQGIFNIKYNLIPDWWISIYPLTYYFIGCYLKEYKINLNKYLNILLFFIVLIISSIINLYFSKGNYFVWGIYNDWGSIFNVLTSSVVDDFLYFNYFKDIDFFSFKGYFKIVPLVLILSISLSIIINIIYKIIDKYIVKRLTKYFIK